MFTFRFACAHVLSGNSFETSSRLLNLSGRTGGSPCAPGKWPCAAGALGSPAFQATSAPSVSPGAPPLPRIRSVFPIAARLFKKQTGFCMLPRGPDDPAAHQAADPPEHIPSMSARGFSRLSSIVGSWEHPRRETRPKPQHGMALAHEAQATPNCFRISLRRLIQGRLSAIDSRASAPGNRLFCASL